MAPKSVFVTGANRGIGYGLVKKFLEDNEVKHVFATARKPDEASALKKLSADPRLHIIQMDVTCDQSIEAAYKQVERVVGDEGLNVLVNNAGVLVKYYLRKPLNRADLISQLDTNTISPLIVTQIFLPLLQKAAVFNGSSGLSASRAAVINISSDAGSIAHNEPGDIPVQFRKAFDEISPPMIGYRASKTALNCITKQLSHDLKDDGILLACFCPGWVKTDYGGPKGMLTIEECASELVPTIYNLKEEQSGGFFKTSGERIPY